MNYFFTILSNITYIHNMNFLVIYYVLHNGAQNSDIEYKCFYLALKNNIILLIAMVFCNYIFETYIHKYIPL